MEAPVLVQLVPTQYANESTVFGPLDLKEFVQTPDGSPIHFRAELLDGEALPVGVLCTDDGLISGFPDEDTEGSYEIIVTAYNEGGETYVQFSLEIGPYGAEAPAPVEPAASAQSGAPKLLKPVPNQMVNEGAAYGPFNLRDFFTPQTGLKFRAELKNGAAFPSGMICTTDGVLTGIPAKRSQGHYEVQVTAENAAGTLQALFFLTIKPALSGVREADYLDKLKAQVWQALEQRLPIPDLGEMLSQEITPLEMNYLLERWGFLKVWDAFNLDPPGELKPIILEGASEHYYVYDRGSCLVGCPKDLYDHARTIEDGMQTARAMAREVYKRGWTTELVGIEKLTRAAWVEIQHLGDKHGKRLEVINFSPSVEDIKLYTNQAIEMQVKSGME